MHGVGRGANRSIWVRSAKCANSAKARNAIARACAFGNGSECENSEVDDEHIREVMVVCYKLRGSFVYLRCGTKF